MKIKHNHTTQMGTQVTPKDQASQQPPVLITEWYTEEEAATLLKLKRDALARLRRQGRISATKINERHYRYSLQDLNEYMNSQPKS